MKEKSCLNKDKKVDWYGILVAICLVVAAVWYFLASRDVIFTPFKLSQKDFNDFDPVIFNEKPERINLPVSAVEPNIVGYLYKGGSLNFQPFIVRLIHGYNMPECMRLKGYTVENIGKKCLNSGLKLEYWKLTSTIADTYLWVTAQLKSSDFSPSDSSTRDMIFPRMSLWDNPSWEPQGFVLSDLKHPFTALKRLVNRKWSNARCNLLVFLKLKKHPWASEEELTLVGATVDPVRVEKIDEYKAIMEIILNSFYTSLIKWKAESSKGKHE